MYRSDRVRRRYKSSFDLARLSHYFSMLPGVSTDLFYLSFRILRSTVPLCPSSIVNFNFTCVTSIPPPLAYSITFLFRIFHICVCIITLPFVLTYGKLKEKLRPFPGIGGWNFAIGDNRDFFSSIVWIDLWLSRMSALNQRLLFYDSWDYVSRYPSLRYRPVSSVGYRWLILHLSTCAREEDWVNSFPQFATRRKVRSIHHPVSAMWTTTESNKYPSTEPDLSSERKSSSPFTAPHWEAVLQRTRSRFPGCCG